jgi:hypothetical protein
VKETDMIVIPAGSLDGDPMMQPQARAFWDSRASWSCGGDDIRFIRNMRPVKAVEAI